MARPREFEPDAALQKAVHLFWEKGYEETSFDDIVDATKVSRYGLYGAFGNKRELFRKALAEYFSYAMGQYSAPIRKPDASLPEIREFFETMLHFGESTAQGKGCLLCNAAIEVAPHDEEIAADVRRCFDFITSSLRAVLDNARRKGELHPDVQVENTAVGLTGLVQSSALMLRLGYPIPTIRQNVEAALSALERR